MKSKKIGSLKEEMGLGKNLTRKEAIGKAGFMAISAATTLMLLSVPKAAHASAPVAPLSEPSGGTWTKRT
jgi:hypothetical protein